MRSICYLFLVYIYVGSWIAHIEHSSLRSISLLEYMLIYTPTYIQSCSQTTVIGLSRKLGPMGHQDKGHETRYVWRRYTPGVAAAVLNWELIYS